MKLKTTLSLLLLTCGLQLSAQTTLTGTVVDDIDGSTLAGVAVMVDGTTTSTLTDFDGKFSIESKSKSGNLVFSLIGYQSARAPYSGSNSFNIVLVTDSKELDEVVVVGYGVQKKSHLTGSISKYNGDNLADVPVTNLDQALQGKIAGVNIQNIEQEAGAAAQIRIRGMGSISAGSDPLVVVDGLPIADGLQFVNMADVESVEVLKDAASAAIYGSRGANGVIMITTKSGNVTKPKYSVSAYGGIKSIYKKYDVMNSEDYLNMLYSEADMRRQSGMGGTGSEDDIAKLNYATSGEKAAYVLEKYVLGSATDWQDEALRETATISSVQFSVSGGTKDLRYFASGNYSQDQGIMYHSQYDKLNFRTKMDANLSKTVKFGVNLSPTYTKRETPGNNFTDFYRWYAFSPVRHTQASADFINLQDPSRNIKVGDWAQVNDFSSLAYLGVLPDGQEWNSVIDGISENDRFPSPSTSANNNPKSVMETQNKTQYTYRLQGSVYLQWEPVKNLFLKTTASTHTGYSETEGYKQRNSLQAGNSNESDYDNKLAIDLLSENTVNYLFSLGSHDFTVLAGATFQKTSTNTAGILGIDLPGDEVTTINMASEINAANTYTRKVENVLISYLGRLNWSYKDKYLASASIRTDGSSMFSKQAKQWGWFPSISAGWVISNEGFMQEASSWLKLKLRGSYGVTGNNNIPPYSYANLLSKASYTLGSIVPGLSLTNDVLANKKITWEQTNEYDAGFDAGFLNNRITLTFDYYYSITRQLLFAQAAMGITGHNQHMNNIGKVRNNGVEIEVSSNNIAKKDFTWRTSFNFAINKNRLLELGGEPYQHSYGERNEIYAAIVGQPAIQFFGYKTDGVWLSDEQIANSGINKELSSVPMEAGGMKVVDVNGDGKLDAYDRTAMGTPFADFTWGLGNTLTYKDFDLSFSFQGSQGGQLINGDVYYNETKKYNRAYNSNRWVSAAFPGDGKTPYMSNGVDQMLTDYVMEDASYISLREVTLGYKLPKKIMQKIGLSSLRVYASALNLLYIMGDGYRGLNPEARITSGEYASPLVNGYQRGAFPLNRTFSFGLDLTF